MIDPLALTIELIARDTRVPAGNEALCIDRLAGLLDKAGFTCRSVDLAPGRPNLVARLDPSGSGHPAIAFTGHLDVVPLGEAPWLRPPFAGEIETGRLYGRGASDMKSGVAAIVAAALEYAEEGGAAPVEIVLTSGEEVGLEGARVLADRPGSLGRAAALVVAEPTANRPAFGNRGNLWLDVHFEGRTAHASEPEKGRNALLAACLAAERFAAFDFGGARHALLGRSTVNVAIMHAGANYNSVPDRARLGLDLRLLPGTDIEALLAELARLAGSDASLEEVIRLPGSWSDPEESWMASAVAIAASITGANGVMGAAPFNTDGSLLAPAYGGIPSLILGPGEPGQAHQTDEWCEVARIEEAARIYLELMRRFTPQA